MEIELRTLWTGIICCVLGGSLAIGGVVLKKRPEHLHKADDAFAAKANAAIWEWGAALEQGKAKQGSTQPNTPTQSAMGNTSGRGAVSQ
jgi:hypothetical protein